MFKNRMHHQLNRVSQIWGWHYILFHFLGGNADMDFQKSNLSFIMASISEGSFHPWLFSTGNPCGGTLKLFQTIHHNQSLWQGAVDELISLKCKMTKFPNVWVQQCWFFGCIYVVIFLKKCMKNIETRYQFCYICTYYVRIWLALLLLLFYINVLNMYVITIILNGNNSDKHNTFNYINTNYI